VIFVFEPELALPADRWCLGSSSHGLLILQDISIEALL
jgi:hypothetical protein